MATDSVISELLLVGIPLEWQSQMATRLESEQFEILFSASKDDAISIIKARVLCAVIIASDLVFDNDISQDLIALTYGKIPTLTIILRETFEKFGQEVVFDKVYNSEAFQEFCTVPFDMDELLPRLRKIIQKAQTASLQK